MKGILVFSGYILIPVLIACIFRVFKLKPVFITYMICAVIIYFYSDIIWTIQHKMQETVAETKAFKCGTGMAMMEFVTLIFFIPGTLLMQALFNYIFTHSIFYRRSYHEKISSQTIPSHRS